MNLREKWNSPTQLQFGLSQFIIWFTFAATMLGVSFLTALSLIYANLIFNVAAGPLLLIVLKPVMFERLKLTTLLTFRFVIVLFVIFNWERKFYTNLVLLLLIINILEATFTDFFKNKQYFNGVSGLFLALGVLGLKGSWHPNEPMYLIQGVSLAATLCYMIGYTIWNWIFVAGEFSPSVALMHVGFLTMPIIGGFILGAFSGDFAT